MSGSSALCLNKKASPICVELAFDVFVHFADDE